MSHKDAETGAEFQSTRPVRGGTGDSTVVEQLAKISIHPPRAGRDLGGPYIVDPSD